MTPRAQPKLGSIVLFTIPPPPAGDVMFAGQTFPAVITRAITAKLVNLRVFIDQDTLPARSQLNLRNERYTSVERDEKSRDKPLAGTWCWPPAAE
jgi:hypothetical protein